MQEVKDGVKYYGLTAYINGEAQDVLVDSDDLKAYFTKGATAPAKDFVPGFYELQNTEVDGDTIVKVLNAPSDMADGLKEPVTPKHILDEGLKLTATLGTDGKKSYSYAKDMAVYLIDGTKVVKSDLATVQEYFDRGVESDADHVADAHKVFVELNSENDITALYFICEYND